MNLEEQNQEAVFALQADIAAIETESGGILSLAAQDLQTGETFAYHAARKVRTASVIKLPILVHVALSARENRLSWDEKIVLTEEEKVGGSGILKDLTAGQSYSIRDLCMLMTVLSDNTATNTLIERLGVGPINARIRDLGLKVTTLFRKSYSADTPESKKWGFGVTTANEMLTLIGMLAENKIGDPALCRDVISILERQQYRDSIPRFLPPTWQYAGKTGGLDHVRNDVALVTEPEGRRFLLSFFCQDIPGVLWTPENPGETALARAAKRLLSYWVRDLA